MTCRSIAISLNNEESVVDLRTTNKNKAHLKPCFVSVLPAKLMLIVLFFFF